MEQSGAEVPIIWNGRRVRAFVPSLLKDRDLHLDVESAARTAAAAAEVAYAAEAMGTEFESLARLLLRSEGVASSYIEGIAAPVVDVVLQEEQLAPKESGAAAWVAANLVTVSEAVVEADTPAELSIDALCRWQRTLLAGGPTPERYVGVIRAEQGWIGGTSPLDAHLVTPPPAELPSLLADLVEFANRLDVDPVAQAAISHAQFELIHPFGDGNGRVGRVLVAWVLVRRLALVVPPPVSVAIAADVGGYTSGLVRFRQGGLQQWVRWFADAVAKGGRAQRALIARVEELKHEWRQRLNSPERKIRSDAAVYAVLDLVPRHLVLTSQVLVEELALTRKAALAALHRLVDIGILTQYGSAHLGTRGQPQTLFVSRELLGLAGANPLR